MIEIGVLFIDREGIQISTFKSQEAYPGRNQLSMNLIHGLRLVYNTIVIL